jgi:hypothetical protein
MKGGKGAVCTSVGEKVAVTLDGKGKAEEGDHKFTSSLWMGKGVQRVLSIQLEGRVCVGWGWWWRRGVVGRL